MLVLISHGNAFLGCMSPGKLSLDPQRPISPSTLFISLLQQWSPATYKVSINVNDPPCYSITLYLIHSESRSHQVTDINYCSTNCLKCIIKLPENSSVKADKAGALEKKPTACSLHTKVLPHVCSEASRSCAESSLPGKCPHTCAPVGPLVCFRKPVCTLAVL